MTDKIEHAGREQIATFLPDAIAKALTSYHRFADSSIPDDPKGFSAHHGACKVAIAHVELLLKLARWADLPDADSVDQNTQVILTAMMEEAHKKLEEYNQNMDAEDDCE